MAAGPEADVSQALDSSSTPVSMLGMSSMMGARTTSSTKPMLKRHKGKTIFTHDPRLFMALVISDPRFEGFFAIIVLVNAVIMGLESEMPAHEETFELIDFYLLFGYTIELFMRWFALRSMIIKGPANILDIVIVLAGWVSYVAHELLADSILDGKLNAINALKVLRALRVLRCVRMLTFFDGLWFTVQSFYFCLKPLRDVCMFLILMLFVFSIFAVELIGNSDSFKGAETQEMFSRTVVAFVTCFQVMTLDEWREIIQPLCDRQPWVYLFFFLFIALAALALMNLVTAALVDDSMSMTRMDEQMETVYTRHRLKKLKPGMVKLFCKIDLDGDGVIQQNEVIDAMKSGFVMPKELKGIVTEAHILDIFSSLDDNGDGQLSIDEFVDGLCCVVLSDVPIETQHILLLQSRTLDQLCRMEKALCDTLNLPDEYRSQWACANQ
jgi:voltage-gated sodium channel